MTESCAVNRGILHTRLAVAVGRSLWPFCVAALLVSNGLLIWKVRSIGGELSRVYQSVNASGLRALVAAPFGATSACAVGADRVHARYLVFFITTRYDAPFYSEEAAGLCDARRGHPICAPGPDSI